MAGARSVLATADMPEGRKVGLSACITVSRLTGEGNRDLRADIAAIDTSSKRRPVGDGPVPELPLGGRVAAVNANGDGSTTFVVNAWNTGLSQSISRKRANPSHAERHLVAYVDSRDRTDGAFFAHITDLVVDINFSPCSPCAGALAEMLSRIRLRQGRPSPGVVIRRAGVITSQRPAVEAPRINAVLRWTTLYEDAAQGTNWADLLELDRAGWRLIAPLGARPRQRSVHTDLVRIETP